MGTYMHKGEIAHLTEGISNITVGLGWDPAIPAKRGFFQTFFGYSDEENIDCDASVIMLGHDEKLAGSKDVITFGNFISIDGSVHHTGDNLTGTGGGDDEQVIIDLSRVAPHIQKLVFVVNIHDSNKRKQHFGLIQNAYIRIVDSVTNQELIKYNLTDDQTLHTSLLVGEIYRKESGWEFLAVGEGMKAATINELARMYL
ncbi:TerD family protein [Cytobacillus spongiae]|uniref:TerD family protein n=1 Tax=Cytobacillus spongiae TaxID=2901381 RepID=UPI001F313C4C|nr:TerD family protein [Cytobacillus spongiae]UII57935.1 TerD family protein [Cytobacillus spongiae]